MPVRRRWLLVGGSLALILTVGLLATGRMTAASGTVESRQQDQMRDAADAIRHLDIARIETLLRQGWDPNTPYDDQGNGALTQALNICEWDPHQDPHKLVLLVRTLLDGGARVDVHNVWGDTPYTIASAERYCGHDHPVTQMLGAYCYRDYRRTGTLPADNVCALGPSIANSSQQRQAAQKAR